MKKALLLTISILAGSLFNAYGVATNYALNLNVDASVDCGRLTSFENLKDYTIQLWFCPEQWTNGATLVCAPDAWRLSLGIEGTVNFLAGNETAQFRSDAFKANSWIQLTIISDNGQGTVIVDGEPSTATLGKFGEIPAGHSSITIGGNYKGRIDELRLWNAPLAPDFNYFIKNTLNRWTPQADALVAYYKFDQADCPDIVEQTAIWKNDASATNNHGVISGAATKTAVTDNPAMQYRINGAYTANERFYDRAIPAAQYLLSNDLIILGIESLADGHLRYVTPNNHAVLKGNAKHVAEHQGRSGVMSFDGDSWLECGNDLWNLADANYTFETWFYIDEWTEDAAIFAKENADRTQGISLRLGKEDRHEMLVSVDGHKYGIINKVEPGKWNHLAIYPQNSPESSRFTFSFILNGASALPSSSLADTEIHQIPTALPDVNMEIGRGFKGKIDNIVFWTRIFDGNAIGGHMRNGCPMPAFDVVQTADIMKQAKAYYQFDNAENPGYDSYSQDSWLAIMEAAYEGCTGYETRISVKSHNGWENTIASAERRKIFAADLAELSKPYDGVELDLEWIYGEQTNLGLLAEEIRKALPEGKSFNVSCHNVAYRFPKDKMQYVDGFTFQQYGPQKVHFNYSHFTEMCETFVNYGFPKDKIITSYSTTTSRGFKNGTAVTEIKGVRADFFDDNYEPQAEIDSKDFNGNTYYFTSPLQTYNRARYTVDNDLAGIFYWDMGNDVPVEHKYNMAKWCSYGLNSNVEPCVAKVDVNHSAGIEGVVADNSDASRIDVYCNGSIVRVNGVHAIALEIFNTSGSCIIKADGNSADVASLAAGLYIIRAKASDGALYSSKFMK